MSKSPTTKQQQANKRHSLNILALKKDYSNNNNNNSLLSSSSTLNNENNNNNNLNNNNNNNNTSSLLIGVPYREGFGYRKQSRWPYMYQKRFFVIKNHCLRIYKSLADFQHATDSFSEDINNNKISTTSGSANSLNHFENNNVHNNNGNNSNNGSSSSNKPSYLYKLPLKYCKLIKLNQDSDYQEFELEYNPVNNENNDEEPNLLSNCSSNGNTPRGDNENEDTIEDSPHNNNNTTSNHSHHSAPNTNSSSEPSDKNAMRKVHKLKFKGKEWYPIVERAVFLATQYQETKPSAEEEFLSNFKSEMFGDDLPPFRFSIPSPPQTTLEFLNGNNNTLENTNNEGEEQKKSNPLKRLSTYFQGTLAVSESGNGEDLVIPTTKGKGTLEDAANVINIVNEPTHSHTNLSTSAAVNHNNNLGLNIQHHQGSEDELKDINDISQLQDLIRKHDEEDTGSEGGNGYVNPPLSPLKRRSDESIKKKQTASLTKRLSTNLAEFFKRSGTNNNNNNNSGGVNTGLLAPSSSNASLCSNDGISSLSAALHQQQNNLGIQLNVPNSEEQAEQVKKEKRKSLFGKLLAHKKH
ncbi:hypothetical protein ABK040_005022 [Willaertia magna]